jgi:hypothetical protein
MTMDATTKERMKHAAEVLQWAADGKEFEYITCLGKTAPPALLPQTWLGNIMSGGKYRLKPAKTRRPFTEQEARRLVGCVLVEPNCPPWVNTSAMLPSTRQTAVEHEWHYHLPGDPDNLKPCWVEE